MRWGSDMVMGMIYGMGSDTLAKAYKPGYALTRIVDDEGVLWAATGPGFRSVVETPKCVGLGTGSSGKRDAINQLWGLSRFTAPLDEVSYARGDG